MRKIMLVIDDFKELLGLETMLRRLGFDVLPLSKEVLVNDSLLSFQPALVVATAKGRAVDGSRLALRLSRLMASPKVILIHASHASGSPPTLSDEVRSLVHGFLEAPLQPEQVISTLAKELELRPESLLEKYRKITGPRQSQPEPRRSSKPDGKVAPESGAPVEASEVRIHDPHKDKDKSGIRGTEVPPRARTPRSVSYEQFLKDNDDGPVTGVLPRELSRRAMDELKDASENEKSKLDRIDQDKREFVKALFLNSEQKTDEQQTDEQQKDVGDRE